MEDYAGRVLADRYRLPLPPADTYDLVETRAFDTYSGQEVLVRQVPLPEVVEAEVVEPDGSYGPQGGDTARGPADPAVRRAIAAAQSAAQVPDHPRLDQVFDVFAEQGSLWIVSELVAARPLAALLAERPLSPFRAAEIASDVLTAVRVLHGHGWTHRNITVRTVLVCDDGRVVLTGLAAGAAEEALCGYAPVPEQPGAFVPGPQDPGDPHGPRRSAPGVRPGRDDTPPPGRALPPYGRPESDAAGPDVGAAGGPRDAGALGGASGQEPYRGGESSADREERGSAGEGHGGGGPAQDPYATDPYATDPYPADPYATGSYTTGGVPRDPAGGTARGGQVPGPSTAGVPAPSGHAALGGGASPVSPYGDAGAPASSGTSGALPRPPRQQSTPGVPAPYGGPNAQPALPPAGSSASGAVRAARAGAIAAYRAGARAAARATEEEQRTAHEPPVAPHEPSVRQTVPPRQPDGHEQGVRDTGTPAYSPYEQRPEQGGPREQGQEQPREQGREQRRDGGSAPGEGGPAAGQRPPAADWWSTPPSGFGDPDGDAEDDEPPSPYRPRLAGTWRDGPSWNDASGGVPAGGRGGDPGAGERGRGGPQGRTPALPAGFTPAREEVRGARPALPPASGGRMTTGAYDALRADAQRAGAQQVPALPAAVDARGPGRWDEPAAAGAAPAYRGPATPLAAERARQARIAIVGAVTERWSPEQAGPVHENWQLAPPIGPATDLWALGALLYRAVQGHAPYPEENAAELVQLVCSEPPAFAEDCGPLRPVVESLLRQDPTERPDFEELRGWLRSLVRSAPEPDAGQDMVAMPTVDGRLPIVRRKGELVRRRRFRSRGRDRDAGRHRHKKGRDGTEYASAEQAALADEMFARQSPARSVRGQEAGDPDQDRGLQADLFEHASGELYDRPARRPRGPAGSGGGRKGPRSLGRILLVLILLGLVGAVVYAMVFLPKSGTPQGQSVQEAPGSSAPPSAPVTQGASLGGGKRASADTPSATPHDTPREHTGAPTVAAGSGTHLAKGYVLRKDPQGFRIAVRQGWARSPINDSGQVRYADGDFTLIVVPGRDTVKADGGDPLAYQSDKERELQPFRDSTWASASGLRRIDVGRQAMAEGQYTWQDSSGRSVYVRNLAMIVDGRYHVIQVIGPDGQRDEVSEIYQQATAAYAVGD